MQKLLTLDKMLKIEKQADSNGLTYDQMMHNAGAGLANFIQERFSACEILGLVGSGNNGGDTLIALSSLASAGWSVKAYLVATRPKTDPLLKQLTSTGGAVIRRSEDEDFQALEGWAKDADILLDGILGTGIKLPLKKEISQVLTFFSDHENLPLVIAVDCPSGVDCRTGTAADECISADLTACMAAVKTGLLEFPAYDLVGQIHVIDIGLPDDLPELQDIDTFIVEENDAAMLLPKRPTNAHKGTFGTAMLIAGSINYTGAVYLAAKAAYRVGAGLVTAAVPGPLHSPLAGRIPEATWLLLPHEMGVISENAVSVVMKNIGKSTAFLIGPGLGSEDTTTEFIHRLILDQSSRASRSSIGFIDSPQQETLQKIEFPSMIIDADGLNALAKKERWYEDFSHQAVLTPHPGEMAALTGKTISEIQDNRIGIAKEYSTLWNTIVVLKGAFTVVADPDGHTCVIPVATPALSKAGTGDVLSGILVGLTAQGMSLFDAAIVGAWVHAQSGLLAEDFLGQSASVLASDVLDSISAILENF
jgi:ADP-dependent NAD(P)H-hydrate dehydratase / NAD(P)H-hydrate epimerase